MATTAWRRAREMVATGAAAPRGLWRGEERGGGLSQMVVDQEGRRRGGSCGWANGAKEKGVGPGGVGPRGRGARWDVPGFGLN